MKPLAAAILLVGFGFLGTACVPAKQAKVGSTDTAEEDAITRSRPTEDDALLRAKRDKALTADPEPQNEPAPKPAEREASAPTSAPRSKIDPIEMLTAQGTAFIIDYHHSAAIESAEATCDEKASRIEQSAKTGRPAAPAKTSGADQAATAKDAAAADDADDDAEASEAAAIADKVEAARKECLKQARDKFVADILQFRRDGLGHVKLVISKRNGSAVKELYVATVELKALSEQAVKVEVKEVGIGQRPIMKDRRDFEISIPNSYGIELKDTVFGRLPYDAKVGLVAN